MSRRTAFVLILVCVAGAAFWWRAQHPSWPIANSPPRSGPIIAFGDSLTQGVGANGETNYPAHLSKLINRPVENRGVGGETIGDGLKRLERDVLAHNPSIVLVCLGGNDLLQRKSAENSIRDLDTIVGRIVENGAMVVLIGVEGLALISEDFGPLYEEVARRHGCIYVEDVLDGIFSDGKLMADQIHPNGEGYRVFAERVAKALEPHL